MVQVGNLGVIGLGATGTVVAGRLLEQGCEVTVYDPDPWKVAALVGAGARSARIPADAAESADVVVVAAQDQVEIEEVLFDCGGVGETLPDNGIVVLACPPTSGFAQSAAGRLAALGLRMVEAWLPGGAGGSSTTVLVGCDTAALAALGPVFGAVGWKVLRTGLVGSVAALGGLLAALAAAPAATFGEDVLDGSVLDARLAPEVHADSTPGDPDILSVPGVMALAGAAARVWSAVRNAARHGVEPTSVERTVAALFPGVRDGAAHDPGHSGPREDAGGSGRRALGPDDAEGVIVDLERRYRIPLLFEARQCRTPAELTALIRTQLTSGA